MVIQQFNRLIKNKWVWGAFAVGVSALFLLPDDMMRGRDAVSEDSAGLLGGKKVEALYFNTLQNDARGIGRNRDNQSSNAKINERAWQTAAALRVADDCNIVATDSDVRAQVTRQFSGRDGSFNMKQYEQILRENNLTPEQFEAILRREIPQQKLLAVLSSAAWVSPAELEDAVNNETDKFTIRIASFTDKDADKVKLDDKTLETYYKDNTNNLALPDLVTVKYVRFAADTAARLATIKVPAEDVSNHWDVVQTEPRFQEKVGTNKVTQTMSLAKAWPMVERDLKLINSLEAYRTNLLFRVYPQDEKLASDTKTDRLEKIAAEEKAKVETSRPFSLDGRGYVKGFMVRPSEIAPGCDDFATTVAELDPESADLRYGVVAGTNCVYLIERSSFKKAHVPTFAEAKEIIRADALKDAQKKAFKASVEKARALAAAELAKGKKFDAALLAGASVTTSIVFTATALQNNTMMDLRTVAPETVKLTAGKLSDFISTATDRRGLVVYVEKREPGDASQAQLLRGEVREMFARGAAMSLADAWRKWNLERLGYTTTAMSSVEEADEAGGTED